MVKYKTISVIIPTYGRPDNLNRAIRSVLNQTYCDWEIIVVDDNDPGNENRVLTEKVMRLYAHDERIIYLKHEKNRNGAAARNTGIKAAKGDVISFLDDDDEYINTRFEKCMQHLNYCESAEIGGVYTGCIFYKNEKVYKRIASAPNGNFLKETLATTFRSHSGSNIFMPRSIVLELKGFDETFTRHQDYEFFVRFFEKYSLIGIDEALLIKHENGQNLPNVTKMSEMKIHYLNKYADLINKFSEQDKRIIYYSNYIALVHMAEEACDKKLARAYYLKAKSYKRISFVDYLRILKAKLISRGRL